MDLSTILSIVAVSLIIYYFLRRERNPFKKHGLPFKKRLFLFGSTWPAVLRLKPYAKVVQGIYNMEPKAKYVGFYNRMTPVVMLRDLELVKSVAIRNFEHFPNHRGLVDPDIDPFFSQNLLLLRDNRWKEIRSLLSPAFTSSKMKAMFKLMSECAVNVSEFLSVLPAEQRVLEIRDVFTKYMSDVIASCAFGISVNSMVDEKNKFYTYGKELLQLHSIVLLKFVMLHMFPRLSRKLGITLISKRVMSFFKDVVSTTIKTRDEKGITRPDMIQLMMETRGKLGPGKELSIDDMTAHAFVFFFGGFETTSSLMSFAAHELAANPVIQERLRAEIDQVLKDSAGEITYDGINGMKYLEAIVCETLRMYPIIPITDRQCAKQFELPPTLPGTKPFVMNEGGHVWLPIYAIQRDPKYFEDPERFDPGRFFNAEKNVNSNAYLPFGMGPRICIANRFAILQTKVALFHIFARCQLKIYSKTLVPMQLSSKGVFLSAKNGFWLQVQARNNSLVSAALSL